MNVWKIFKNPDWHQSIVAWLALLLSVVAIFQAAWSVHLSRQSLYLATTPALDVTARGDSLIVKNRGMEDVFDVEVRLVAYKLKKEPPSVEARSAHAGVIVRYEVLKPNGTFTLADAQVGSDKMLGAALQHWDGFPMKAIVITFRRSFDYRKFMHFEPLIGFDGVVPIYSQESSGMSGGWSRLFDLVPELEKKERALFGASKEVGG